MKTLVQTVVFLIVAGLMGSACTPFVPIINVVGEAGPSPAPSATAAPSATPEASARKAKVQSVELRIASTDPLQVVAVVRGHLTESCATLGQSQVQYAGNTFRITVYAITPSDQGCLQSTTPFETAIPLDVHGLPPGSYMVLANGVSAAFTLAVLAPSATATATSKPVPQGCIDSAAFVSDVTIPDNSIITSGASFTKIWRLKNTGSCTWNRSYLVHYISGTTTTQSPGYYILEPGQTVAPGQSVNVSVGMTAPVASGKYASYWGLRKENGGFMPIQGGASGNSFYVKF